MFKKGCIPWNKSGTFKKGAPVTLVCKECEKEFTIAARLKDRKFCSKVCMYKNRHLEKECPECHNVFVARQCSTYCGRSCRNKANPPEFTEEHREKLSKSLKGKNAGEKNHWYGKTGELSPTWREKSPLWNGGSSFFPYSLDWSMGLKKMIRERDNNECAFCGEDGKDVHHIDYDKNNCSEDNLITLCRNCHMETNHNRGAWQYLFNLTTQ